MRSSDRSSRECGSLTRFTCVSQLGHARPGLMPSEMCSCASCSRPAASGGSERQLELYQSRVEAGARASSSSSIAAKGWSDDGSDRILRCALFVGAGSRVAVVEQESKPEAPKRTGRRRMSTKGSISRP